MEILIKLILAHIFGDFVFQNEYMACFKNRYQHSEELKSVNIMILMYHATIHAGLVYFITGDFIFFIAELIIHAIVDDKKCAGKITYLQDQVIHLICKLLYFLLLTY